MGQMMAIFVVCFFVFSFFLISSATAAPCSDPCLHQSKAAYFPLSTPLKSGACGYGSLQAKGFYNGYIAAGVPSLFRDGVGCGACFHVRCKDKTLCRGRGTNVVLTDSHKGSNKTELVLSERAFISMASKGKARELLKLGTVDMEYRRIPCEYKNQNLSIRIDESSNKPNNLAITFLYQGGQTEIALVEFYQERSFTSWVSMSKKYGAVWETSPVPQEPLNFRLFVYRGYDRYFIFSATALPVDWKVGAVYDLGVQMNDVFDKRDGCSPDCTAAAGACGYGSLAKGFNNGYIALVRCKNKTLCGESGTNVVLTDSHNSSETDLVLSDRAFISMASKGKARELLKLGIVDVEYRRIRCEYKNQNLSVRVDESSKKPNNLVITVLYQGGKTGIYSVDVFQEGTSLKSYMTNKYGAVWEMSPVPEAGLIFSLFTVGGYDRAMVWAQKALPADWKVGAIYDLGVQMNEVIDARDGCPPDDCTTGTA
ncbi:Expansin/pollen allergen [Macleaya cordata]|uniref:Expansin/pollen allergen n=1 Tax=Macleaya cordata TaxID=56857 RepID=A0A200QZY1_MACCD|nr:Expansin/pollen allergen [Macleaya cordata]